MALSKVPTHEQVMVAKRAGGSARVEMLRLLRVCETERRIELRAVENLLRALGEPV